MRGLFRILTIVLVFGSTVSILNAQKDVSAVISEANDRFETFFNDGDADGVASLYTVDARLMPPNHAVIEGRANIRDFWGGFIAAGVKLELSTISALAYGKTAIEEGAAKVYADGTLVDEAKYVLEWRKVNGEWQIHKDIFSSINPLPGQ